MNLPPQWQRKQQRFGAVCRISAWAVVSAWLAIATAVPGFALAQENGAGPTVPEIDKSDVEATVMRETTSDLPDIDSVARPTAAEILTQPPADWLIVDTNRVMKVEPVSPRPNTLEVMRTRVDAFAATKPQTTDAAKVAQWRKEFDSVHDISVRLIDDLLGQDYLLNVDHVDDIISHEQHALNEAARLRDARQFSAATELLEHVRRRDSDWPGLAAATNKLLFAEATSMLNGGQAEQSLAVLTRVFERDSEFPNLNVRVGQAVDKLGSKAIAENNPRRSRYFENRLRKYYPGHRVLKVLADARTAEARRLLSLAKASRSKREASELVGQVARYAPDLPGLRAAHETLFERYPVLHVGALRPAAPARNRLLSGTAEMRLSELTSARLFEPDAVEGDIVRFSSRFVESWSPEDLERRAIFTLRPQSAKFDAYRMAEAIQQSASGSGPDADRWYAAVRSVRPLSPTQIDLDLGRGPLRLDALIGKLNLPLRPLFTPTDFSDDVSKSSGNNAAFRSTGIESQRPDGQFAEIVEHGYETAEAFGRAIRRDEIALAVDVPPFLVARLTQEDWFQKEVILDKYTLPTTHLLQFRVGSPPGDSPALRIALERALDRPQILASAILHNASQNGPGSEFVRTTGHVFPSFSYGNEQSIEPRPFDPAAAVPLALLAKRELADRWRPLRLIAPEHPQVRDAAVQIVKSWRDLGIDVSLVPVDETLEAIESQSWDIVYRVVSIAEPSLELWPLLSVDGQATLAGIEHLSEPLRERLIRLENTRDWPAATRLLAEADRAIHEQALLIPLWEVDRLSIRRRAIRGVPEDSISPYHALLRWRVEPVFSTSAD